MSDYQEIRRPADQETSRANGFRRSPCSPLSSSPIPRSPHSPRPLILMLVVFLLSMLQPSTAIHAQTQTQAITIRVRAAYAGVYRVNEWFPLTIELRNDGADVRGELEWSLIDQNDGPVFRSQIDLPRGSQKRMHVALLSRSFSRNAHVRIIVNGQTITQSTISLEPIDVDTYLLAVISNDPTLLNVLNNFQLSRAPTTRVQHITLDELPEQAASLRAVNTLVLHNIDSAQLSAQQRAALHSWVTLGGQLIVSGGVQGQLSAAGVADLLPAIIRSTLHEGSIEKVLELGSAPLPSGAQTASLNDLEPHANARDVIGDGLIWEQHIGAGKSLVIAFDLSLLRGWQDEPMLWKNVLQAQAQFIPTLDLNNSGSDLIRRSLQLPGLSLPPTIYLVMFLFFYILLIGPLNYLLLRQLKRLEWAWISIPVLVAIVVAGLYAFGFATRGGQSKLIQLSVVQASEGEQKAQLSAFIGLFSPFRSSYTLGLPAQSLVLDQERWNSNNPSAPVQLSTNTVDIPDALVDVSSVRSFSAESSIDINSIVESHLDLSNETVSTITSRHSQTLRDVLIVHEEKVSNLGDIQPGQTLSFNMNSQVIFPWGANLNETGLFNRNMVLTSLFNGDHTRFGDGKTFNSNDSYMLAWTDTPLMPVQLNGVEQSQQGNSLYVIRLKTSGQ